MFSGCGRGSHRHCCRFGAVTTAAEGPTKQAHAGKHKQFNQYSHSVLSDEQQRRTEIISFHCCCWSGARPRRTSHRSWQSSLRNPGRIGRVWQVDRHWCGRGSSRGWLTTAYCSRRPFVSTCHRNNELWPSANQSEAGVRSFFFVIRSPLVGRSRQTVSESCGMDDSAKLYLLHALQSRLLHVDHIHVHEPLSGLLQDLQSMQVSFVKFVNFSSVCDHAVCNWWLAKADSLESVCIFTQARPVIAQCMTS